MDTQDNKDLISDWNVIGRNLIDVLDAGEVYLGADGPGVLPKVPLAYIGVLGSRLLDLLAILEAEAERRGDAIPDDPNNIAEKLEARSAELKVLIRQRIEKRLAGVVEVKADPADPGIGQYL